MRLLPCLLLALALAGCASKQPPKAAAQREQGDRKTEPPRGSGNFSLGMSPQQASEACRSKGRKLLDAPSGLLCDNAGTNSVRGFHGLEFCGDRLCWILAVMLLPPGSPEWLGTFAYMRKKLIEQFGEPDREDVVLPEACEERFFSCLSSGEAHGSLLWLWPDGHVVMLRTTGGDTTPSLGVAFATPDGAQRAIDNQRKKRP